MGKSKCRAMMINGPKTRRLKTQMFGILIQEEWVREEGRIKFTRYGQVRDKYSRYRSWIDHVKSTGKAPSEPIGETTCSKMKKSESTSVRDVGSTKQSLQSVPSVKKKVVKPGKGWKQSNLDILDKIEQHLNKE